MYHYLNIQYIYIHIHTYYMINVACHSSTNLLRDHPQEAKFMGRFFIRGWQPGGHGQHEFPKESLRFLSIFTGEIPHGCWFLEDRKKTNKLLNMGTFLLRNMGKFTSKGESYDQMQRTLGLSGNGDAISNASTHHKLVVSTIFRRTANIHNFHQIYSWLNIQQRVRIEYSFILHFMIALKTMPDWRSLVDLLITSGQFFAPKARPFFRLL